MDGNSGSAMGIGNRRETMTTFDEQSKTVIQQWVLGKGMK
jgi:hypothetical protein